MKNLFEESTISELKSRITQLNHTSTPLWGKMNVAQMLAHCTAAIQNGNGEITPSRVWIGYLIAPFWKYKYYNDQPFKVKNQPTHPSFKMVDSKDFEVERNRLLSYLELFHEEGTVNSVNAVHPLLGKFKPEQWAVGLYKHTDHHLRQFGV